MTRWGWIGLLAALLPAAASAHSHLVDPPSRSEDNFLMEGPCGGVPRGEATVLEAGATIDMRWIATQNHFNVYRVAFSPQNDEGFEDNVLGSRPDEEDVFEYVQPVPMPMCTCEACTLQLAQFTASGNLAYYSCADIELVAPPGEDVQPCVTAEDETTGDGTTTGGPAPQTSSGGVDETTSQGALDPTSGGGSSAAAEPEPSADGGCRTGGSGNALLAALLVLGGWCAAGLSAPCRAPTRRDRR